MRRGFTLLELIIVIIVIGVLAALALPQYQKAVERAQVGKGKNALALISRAEKMYMARNDGDTATGDIQTAGGGMGPAGLLLNYWVEMDEPAADTSWDYTVTGGRGTFVITATRVGSGAWAGTTITLTNLGVEAGTHNLR